MNRPQTIIRLRHAAIFGDLIEFHLARRLEAGRIGVAKPLVLDVIEPDQQSCVPDQPLFKIDLTEAQHLMDELWLLGIRPTEGHGSTGQLAATEKHLAHVTGLLEKTLTTSLNVANATLLPHLPPKA